MYLNAVLPISTFFFMNITVKTVHICRFTGRYYLWNDRFSVLSQKFCPFNRSGESLKIAIVNYRLNA